MKKIHESPVAKGAIVLSVFTASVLGGIAAIDTKYTGNIPSSSARAPRPKPEPKPKPHSMTYLAEALQNLNLGWGEADLSFVGSAGIAGYSVLPDGYQIQTLIYARGNSSNGKVRVNPTQAQQIDVNVIAPGINLSTQPFDFVRSYWFVNDPDAFDTLGGSGFEASTNDSAQSRLGIIATSAFGNGIVQTYSATGQQYPDGERVFQRFTGKSLESSDALAIEDQALSIAEHVSRDINLPSYPEVVQLPPSAEHSVAQLLHSIM